MALLGSWPDFWKWIKNPQALIDEIVDMADVARKWIPELEKRKISMTLADGIS